MLFIFSCCVYITVMDLIMDYTCKDNGCEFRGRVLHHADHCRREIQNRPVAFQLNAECRDRGCYILRQFRQSADGIIHNNHRVEVRSRLADFRFPGMWDFLRSPAAPNMKDTFQTESNLKTCGHIKDTIAAADMF